MDKYLILSMVFSLMIISVSEAHFKKEDVELSVNGAAGSLSAESMLNILNLSSFYFETLTNLDISFSPAYYFTDNINIK